MITTAIVVGFAWVVSTLVGFLPTVTPPDFVTSFSDRTTSLFSGDGVQTVLQFVPGGVLVAAIGGVLAVVGASFLVRFGRIAISHFTGGGGAI